MLTTPTLITSPAGAAVSAAVSVAVSAAVVSAAVSAAADVSAEVSAAAVGAVELPHAQRLIIIADARATLKIFENFFMFFSTSFWSYGLLPATYKIIYPGGVPG